MGTESKPLYKVVEDRLRLRIASGELARGAKLPSVRELAATFGTNVFTVHKALTPLEREGLIVRKRKLGTVVNDGSPRLACVGLYFAAGFIYEDDTAFYRSLCDLLIAKLDAMGWGHRLWTETLRIDDAHVPGAQIEAVLKAARAGQIQALIAPLVNSPAFDAFNSLNLPVAFIASGVTPRKIVFDTDGMIRAGLAELRRQGCRSVGLITNMSPSVAASDGKPHDYQKFHTGFETSAATLGMKLSPSWIRCPKAHTPVASQLRFGYEQFSELWSLRQRPEAVFVYPDATAKGVLTAVLERRIDVPRELKLLFHRHEEVEFLCPLPVTWATSRVAETADALTAMIQDQAAGKRIASMVVPFHIETKKR